MRYILFGFGVGNIGIGAMFLFTPVTFAGFYLALGFLCMAVFGAMQWRARR